MKLFGHPISSNSRRVQMLCEELRVAYDYHVVDLAKLQQHSAEFLAINPNGKVPVIDDAGFVLWESQAIMRYLALRERAEELYPQVPQARARIEQWLDWNATSLGPAAGRLWYNTVLAPPTHRDEAAMVDSKRLLGKALPILEVALARHAFVAGDKLTLADIALAPNFAYLEMCRFDLAAHTAIASWYGRMSTRESFKKTAPAH